MKKIKLTQNKYALVDDRDFEWLSQWSWCYSHGYALRATNAGDRIYMHRAINDTPKGFETDHINRDKLDNQRMNLRTVSRAQNSMNHPAHKNNITGIKGVNWSKNAKKYYARIVINRKKIHLGYFDDIETATKARKEAEKIYHAI